MKLIRASGWDKLGCCGGKQKINPKVVVFFLQIIINIVWLIFLLRALTHIWRNFYAILRHVDALFRYEPNRGRFAVATRDIPVADVVCVERPCISTILPEYLSSNCAHCFKSMKAPMPCNTCSKVMYCSYKCRCNLYSVDQLSLSEAMSWSLSTVPSSSMLHVIVVMPYVALQIKSPWIQTPIEAWLFSSPSF